MLVFVLSKEERCKLRYRIFLNIRKFDIAFLFKTDFPEKMCFSLQDIIYTNILFKGKKVMLFSFLDFKIVQYSP